MQTRVPQLQNVTRIPALSSQPRPGDQRRLFGNGLTSASAPGSRSGTLREDAVVLIEVGTQYAAGVLPHARCCARASEPKLENALVVRFHERVLVRGAGFREAIDRRAWCEKGSSR